MSRRGQLMRRRRRGLVLCLGGVALVVGSIFTNGTASADDGSLIVDAVDASSGALAIDVVHTGDSATDAVRLNVDGTDVSPTSVRSFSDQGISRDVMVVLDTSSGLSNGLVQVSKETVVKNLAPGSNSIDRAGLVTIGGNATRRSGLVSSPVQFADSIGTLSPSGTTSLWDGVATAARSFGTDASTQSSRHIVVVAATNDSTSNTSYSEAMAAVRAANARIHVIAIEGGTAPADLLFSMVSQVGGTIQSSNFDGLAGATAKVGTNLANLYRITAPAPSARPDQVVPLTVTWGPLNAEVGYEPGTLNVGTDALRALVVDDGVIDGLLSSSLVKYFIVALGCAAAGMVTYSIASMLGRRSERLSFALRHYDGFTVDVPYEDDNPNESFAKTEILKRAVAITGDFAQKQGVLTKVEDLLERADLPLRPAEALFFYVSIVIVTIVAATLLSGDVFVMLICGILAILGPKFFVSFRAKRRAKKFVAQLPDMLTLLAGTLRAGYSIAQGFEAISKEIDGPMGKELRRIMAEARLGRPLEEALDASAVRVKSEDFGWAVMAIRIQREVGGNLAELLLTVADTMTQRERLRRDVNSLTAEGRMSAIILGMLPPGMGLVMMAMNPEYIGRLFEDALGLGMLGAGLVAMLIGFAWMKKIITIEI